MCKSTKRWSLQRAKFTRQVNKTICWNLSDTRRTHITDKRIINKQGGTPFKQNAWSIFRELTGIQNFILIPIKFVISVTHLEWKAGLLSALKGGEYSFEIKPAFQSHNSLPMILIQQRWFWRFRLAQIHFKMPLTIRFSKVSGSAIPVFHHWTEFWNDGSENHRNRNRPKDFRNRLAANLTV